MMGMMMMLLLLLLMMIMIMMMMMMMMITSGEIWGILRCEMQKDHGLTSLCCNSRVDDGCVSGDV